MFHKISRKTVIAIGLAGSIAATSLWFYAHQKSSLIYDLNIAQDTQPILDIFASDSYWLDANYDTTQDKYRRMLKYGYVNDNPMFPNRLKFKVLRDQGKFVGFTAYYKLTPTKGKILFVAVHPDMRGKRYGQVLMQTALKELKNMGIREVELVTRTSNTAAQKLYLRTGMHETFKDADYVYFGIRI